jgi:uncharacterized protein YjbJ (UPF0337 family)
MKTITEPSKLRSIKPTEQPSNRQNGETTNPLASAAQANQSQQPLQQPLQQQESTANDTTSNKWKTMIGAAKEMWNKLTDQELIKSQGNEQELTSLVRRRYSVPQEKANQQVKKFLAKHTN